MRVLRNCFTLALGAVIGLQAAAQTMAGVSCAVECRKAASPFCIRVEASNSVKSGFRQLNNRIQSLAEGEVIQAKDLMAMFSVQADPCVRSETKLAAGIVRNSGEACILSTQLGGLVKSKSIPARLLVPAVLELRMTHDGTVTALSPVSGVNKQAPYLRIDDSLLHGNWGGLITGGELSEQQAIFATSAGCLAVKLN